MAPHNNAQFLILQKLAHQGRGNFGELLVHNQNCRLLIKLVAI